MSTSARHDQMVAALITHLLQNGWTELRADLPGYDCSSKITWSQTGKGHIPDVTALKNGVQYLFEVEDETSISLDHSAEQFRLFDAYAQQHKAVFSVLVPTSAKANAETVLAGVGAVAQVWTI